MSRAALVVGAVAAALALGVTAAWFFVLRDTAEPVGVDEAVTSFRTDTEPTSDQPSPIPEGVYVYRTEGDEKTDALTGVTHRYPKRSTITVRADECGVSLLWRVLDGRSTEWVFCVTPKGWELRSQDERHTFFGRTEHTTYTCTHSPIRPDPPSVGSRWRVSCSTSDADETGLGTVVAGALVRAAGATLDATHVRKTTRFTGAIRGTARYDFWFHRRLGLPVKIAMVSRTTNDSPVGDVHYDEDVTLLLTSLKPRR